MTFKHKLSVRLALLRDALLLLPFAALLACEAALTGISLTRVAISPAHITLQTGQAPSRFTAVGLTGRGDTANIAVTWRATGGTIAGVTTNGRQHFAEYQPSTLPGTYLVIAARGPGGAADTSTVTVIRPPVASVALSHTVAVLLVGTSLQLTATPQDSNRIPLAQRLVTWSSSAPAVASVTTSGQISGLTAGSATITATSEGKSVTAAITVTSVPVASVIVSPASASISTGATRQLAAVTTDSAGNTLPGRVVTWSSSNTAVATVSGSGLVTAQAAGSATITGTSESKSGAAAITVVNVPVASVTVSPASATIQIGATQLLSAVTNDSAGNTLAGRVVTWSTSNSSVAAISGGGLVTGQTAGSATITATSEGRSGTSAVTIPAPPPPGSRAGYYVAPNGSSSGTGSSSSPWSLSYALGGAAGRIQPGDTVWLRGGTYVGDFTSNLTGSATNPTIVRQYPGERATINGTLFADGRHVWYWGFEVMRSTPVQGGLGGVYYRATGVRFINLVIHDASSSGILSQPSAFTGGEIYGCLVYNNGADYNFDHGMYVGNRAETLLIGDNVVFNNWAYGLHHYSTTAGELTNLHLEGNVVFGNATISSPRNTAPQIFVGGTTAQGIQITNNFTYDAPSSGNWAARIGVYSSTNQDVVVTGNTFVSYVDIGTWNTATVSANTFHSTANVLSTPAAVNGFGWSGNIHYRDPSASAWLRGTSAFSFSEWKMASGLGGSDQIAGTRPSGVHVVVRPNKYEAGRANIIVYNWDRLPTVSVDVSAILRAGDNYEVRNVQDFFGPPVVSGAYDGGPLTLPMAGIAPAAPVGRAYTPAPVTGPEFNAFVVLRRGN